MAAVSLSEALKTSPHLFLTPPRALHASALARVSHLLSPVAADLSALHDLRTASHRQNRKRKRGQDRIADDGQERRLRPWDEKDALRLQGVYTEGFEVEQVWEQVRRVVEAVESEVERDLAIREEHETEGRTAAATKGGDGAERLSGFDLEGVDDDEDARPGEDEDENEDKETSEGEDEDGNMDLNEARDLSEDIDDSGDMLDDDTKSDGLAEQPSTEYVPDPHGLNDGFFSIDEFNKQSEFLERVDARGDDDGAASDEEEVDWAADPMADGTATDSAQPPPRDDGESGEEDGPTFGDMDLDAPEDESDNDQDQNLEGGDLDGLDDGMNANNIMYKDFFAPPPKKASKKSKKAPSSRSATEPVTNGSTADTRNDDEDPFTNLTEDALSRVHRDLFSDDDDENGSEGQADLASDPDDEGDPSSRRSRHDPQDRDLTTHGRRLAALSREISSLERVLVSAKPWALSGEASSRSRPLNSLLEEDLDFERAGKPVPVPTAEASQSLDALVRARIIAQDFQDVIRRRPDDLATGPTRRRVREEVDDKKDRRGLGEVYEQDHLLRGTRTGTKDDKDDDDEEGDGRLTEAEKRERTEVAELWKTVRAQLDSLSNFTLRPRARTTPETIIVRTDVPVARGEDARPGGGAAAAAGAAADGRQGGLETSRLAPGEVYRLDRDGGGAGERAVRGEVLVGGRKGEVVGVEERERGEGRRARRRAKERARKQSAGLLVEGKKKKEGEGGKGAKGAKDQAGLVGQLKKGGVKVIGDKGELTDVAGRKVGAKREVGVGGYKL